MSYSPRVSAVMPVYNGAAYLAESIRSVLAQDFRGLELIVVDDGSADNSAEIAAGFGAPVRVIRCAENGGVARARNRGVEEARGEYVVYCDGDDIHLPYRVSTLVKLLDQNPAAAIACSEFSTFEGGAVTRAFHLRTLKMGPRQRELDVELADYLGPPRSCRELGLPVPEEHLDQKVFQGPGAAMLCLMHLCWAGASMYRRQAMLDHGGHDPDLRTYEDWQLSGKIARKHHIVFVDVPLLLYRMHPSQIHTQLSNTTAQTYYEVLRRVWLSDAAFCRANKELIQRVHSLAHLKLGHYEADRGNWRSARNHFFQSVRIRPAQGGAYKELALATLRSLSAQHGS